MNQQEKYHGFSWQKMWQIEKEMRRNFSRHKGLYELHKHVVKDEPVFFPLGVVRTGELELVRRSYGPM